MKIIAIKEFDNYKQAPLLPFIPEPTKVTSKDDLTSIEISSRPGTAGAAEVKVGIKILEGLDRLDDSPHQLIAWRKTVESAFIGLSCTSGTQQMAVIPQFTRGFAWTTLEVKCQHPSD